MDQTAKQQAVESIKQATNVLVTVSSNPSVDQLSAALGLTLMLSKLEKHATAVFSGNVPEAIKFLEPSKTLENNVDSLRDFIIALDKEKADKLRYKVEDDVVRIFITPYRTKITKDDFEFSQGDFNVDVVIALGVEKREDLDNAIKAHGRILHDSAVVTINTGHTQSNLGEVNWSDDTASSLCEMLVSVSESFGSGLLDQQISTAFLTGIVAATERFSNDHTTPKVMTMSAQLMASGANQQLIANELQMGKDNQEPVVDSPNDLNISKEDESPNDNDQELTLNHSEPQLPSVPPLPEFDDNPSSRPPMDARSLPEPVEDRNSDKTLKELENEIAALTGSVHTPPEPNPTDQELSLPEPQIIPRKSSRISPGDENNDEPSISDIKGQGPLEQFGQKPVMGGTFNATSSEALDETIKQREQDASAQLLSHDGPDEETTAPTIQVPPIQPEDQSLTPQGPSTIDINAARDAVNNAVNNQPFNPANNPTASIGSADLPLEQPQQINIDDSGMVIMPGATPPPGPPDDAQTPTIL